MERVHQLLAEGTLDAEDDDFWNDYWPHIASAKVSLETKVAAYQTLKHRASSRIQGVNVAGLYWMVLADRRFVAEVDLSVYERQCYCLFVMWFDDDVAALTTYYRKMAEDGPDAPGAYDAIRGVIARVRRTVHAPRCMRFLLQEKGFREMVMLEPLLPFVQRLVEELVQPTDRLNKDWLLAYGQSVKLIGMRVSDEELVAAWLRALETCSMISQGWMSVLFARKLHALATPDQCEAIKHKVLWGIAKYKTGDGCFELAWLCGLLGPSYPNVQAYFRQNHVNLFPALIFAMIVAMCDGYLEATRETTETQRRFIDIVRRLPMDLQALVSLRLWKESSTVIQTEKFDRAFLAII